MPAPSENSFYNLPKMENKKILVAMTKGLRGNAEYIEASLFSKMSGKNDRQKSGKLQWDVSILHEMEDLAKKRFQGCVKSSNSQRNNLQPSTFYTLEIENKVAEKGASKTVIYVIG